MGSAAGPTHVLKPSFESNNSDFLILPLKNPTKVDLHSGMAEWDSLPIEIIVLIADYFESFEDLLNLCLVCKSWQSVSSICGKGCRTLPPRYPWVMLTDIAEANFPQVTRDMDYQDMLAEEVEKNEHIEGMNKRRFYSFSTSKIYEFELPEATRKKCIGVSNGWLMTIGYDLQINLLHPFSRQQVGLPPFLSFKDQYRYEEDLKPQSVLSVFVFKAVMSSNPYNSSTNKDCVILAIYGQYRILAFARPGDKDWTDIYPRIKCYTDIVYFKGKFYAIDVDGVVVVCEIHYSNRPKVTPIAYIPEVLRRKGSLYLVESSGSLLVVVRFRKGPNYRTTVTITYPDGTEVDIEDDDTEDVHYTIGFSIFKLEECNGEMSVDAYPCKTIEELDGLEDKVKSSYAYPYRFIPVYNLGDKSLFLGYNASVSLPSSSSNNVKANHIYFSDDESETYGWQPFGGGPDTGIYDVESGNITLHDASEFKSHLTPPMWYI